MIKAIFFFAVLFSGILLGVFEQNYLSGGSAFAQSEEKFNKLRVEGHGRAYTSWEPSEAEKIIFSTKNESEKSFNVIPEGKKLILTDVVYNPQGSVKQNITVNLSESGQGNSIMFQIKVSPDKSEVVNFCSGYTIDSGKSVKAYTDTNAKDGQYISISVTGYLIDE
jgi:hypothetical protein